MRETSDEFRALCDCDSGFTGEVVVDLTRFARVYNEALEQCEGMARALIGESRRRPTLAKELIADVLEPFHRSIATYLKGRKKAGLVRRDLDVAAFAEILTSALMGGMLRRTSGLSALDRDQWVNGIVSALARGALRG